jgi:DNA-binding transcriptional LysR family regulator
MDLLAQMATFVRVVDGKSLSAAARGLHLSLPAVSRQLRALETELGASLVTRSTRRMHLTEAGERWYTHCVRVLREIEDAKASVRTTKSVRGRLVVSASLSFGLHFVVRALPGLSVRHPRLAIDLRLEDQLVDLVGEGVDVALRAGSPPPDSTAFLASPLTTMTRVLVAAPAWLRRHPVKSPLQLVGVPCLTQITPGGAVVRWVLQKGVEMVTPEVSGPLRATAPLALRELAIGGAGIAYIPEWIAREELAARRLVRVLPDWSSPPIAASAVYRTSLRGDARVQAFVAALRDAL